MPGQPFPHRTSVIGHAGCKELVQPEQNRSNIEQWAANYNHRGFGMLNEVAIEELPRVYSEPPSGPEGAHKGSFEVLDVSMSELRPDGHFGRAHMHATGPDCLHYCVPRPPDEWNKLLYHLMLYKDEHGWGTSNEYKYTPFWRLSTDRKSYAGLEFFDSRLAPWVPMCANRADLSG